MTKELLSAVDQKIKINLILKFLHIRIITTSVDSVDSVALHQSCRHFNISYFPTKSSLIYSTSSQGGRS